MKKIATSIILLFITISLFSFEGVFAAEGIVNIPTINQDKILEVSIQPQNIASGNIITDVNNIGFSILKSLKVILQGILLIYMVYIGVSMILSMGHDEDKLTKSKNQIWYTLIALVFINIPGNIYQAINHGEKKNVDKIGDNGAFTGDSGNNILVDYKGFLSKDGTIYGIISFLEVMIFAVAIFVIIRAGLSIMMSAGKEDKLSAGKKRVLYSVGAIIFVGFIEAWKQFAIKGELKKGGEVFGSIFDLALLFAGPVAMIFLTLAGYYYITSNGEEERIKKAKSIIVNTLIGVLLLLVIASFLNDLIGLTI